MHWRHLAASAIYEETVKKSRFVARLIPARDPAEAKTAIEGARRAEYGARHHATAQIIGPDGAYQRSNDDAEPPGTAGLPMLEVLRREKVTDAVAIVSRHFGGVLLGKAGLMRAYAGAVAGGVAVARFNVNVEHAVFALEVPAAEAGRANHLLRAFAASTAGTSVDAVYGESARFEVVLPVAAAASFAEFAGSARLLAGVRRAGTRLVTMAE
ncbi:MAG: YigZ family protein [Bifidobacteriaceae bacterium]|jgi:putative IMPACT (imprinted ancient) family translation regulator|nr:YigZ family protein [Bifidobacteriaceae bacterium]